MGPRRCCPLRRSLESSQCAGVPPRPQPSQCKSASSPLNEIVFCVLALKHIPTVCGSPRHLQSSPVIVWGLPRARRQPWPRSEIPSHGKSHLLLAKMRARGRFPPTTLLPPSPTSDSLVWILSVLIDHELFFIDEQCHVPPHVQEEPNWPTPISHLSPSTFCRTLSIAYSRTGEFATVFDSSHAGHSLSIPTRLPKQ